MIKPQRVQRKRIKGWKMPPNTIYVGRPTIWGNPWAVDNSNSKPGYYLKAKSREEAVKLFRENNSWNSLNKDYIKEKLKGKNLACWCPLNQPCHADILLEIANDDK